MNRALVIGEDALCCALGEKLIRSCVPHLNLDTSISKNGRTKLFPELRRYSGAATPECLVLCIGDTDRDSACSILRQYLPEAVPPTFVFRLAVTESESWALADRERFAAHFCIPVGRIPRQTDQIQDPKHLLVTLMKRSKIRFFREEMVSMRDPNKPGTGYNQHLEEFVRDHWRVTNACESSESLQRAVARLQSLAHSRE